MLVYDLASPKIFPWLILWLFVMVMGRYLAVAGLFFGWFHGLRLRQWRHRKVNQRAYRRGQWWQEICWSTVTAFIFAIAGALTAILWQQGYTAIYLDVTDYGWFYFGFSILLVLLIHETYYYWLHRWMHQPRIFQRIHQVHHHSLVTSPWTSFSFHPLEALLQAVILPAIALIIPLHPYAIVIYLTLMTFSSVINHLNIEIYPRRLMTTFPGNLLIGATHHSFHHAQHRCNYGLCFTFWDRWCGTESAEYVATLRRKV